MKSTDLFNSKHGFTLLELIIVIGIIAILGTAAVVVLNPVQMFKQSRDATRISDIQNLNNALVYYRVAGGSTFGSPNTIYISLPSDQADCSDLDLPAAPGGWSYACRPASSYRNIDGTGWIPAELDLAQGAVGALFSSLPVDPVNTARGDYYYTYIHGDSWALSSTLESSKYLASSAASDGGVILTRFEVGSDLSFDSNLTTGGGLWSCGSALTDSRDGKIYGTVLIGSQCWFAQNINVGTLISGASSQGASCSSINKYCYDDTEGNCATDGGLYQWDQAMCGSTIGRAKGICPSGWHIPAHDEFTDLERSICTSGTCVTNFPYDISTTGWLGTNEGSKLSSFTSGGTNSSGFTALMTGFRNIDTSFVNQTSDNGMWTSSESGGDAWQRYLSSGNAGIYRITNNKAYGWSVRCLKN